MLMVPHSLCLQQLINLYLQVMLHPLYRVFMDDRSVSDPFLTQSLPRFSRSPLILKMGPGKQHPLRFLKQS